MRCSYCSDAVFRHRPHTITSDVIAALPRLFAVLQQRFSHVDVIFHGGEPFFAPASRFREIFAALSRYNASFSAQTNLFDLRLPAYDAVLPRLRSLSITIDGPGPLHDTHRRDAQGKGTFDRILNNLGTLRAAYPQLHIGALFTVSRESLPFAAEIYALFKEARIDHIGFNPVVDGCASLRPADYVCFLKELFSLWSSDPAPLDIHLFTEIVKYVTGIQPAPSTCQSTECYRHIISVSPEGNINPCMVWHDDDRFRVDTLTDLDAYWSYYEEKITTRVSRRECSACAFEPFCRGGCPHEYVGNQWRYCGALQEFLQHAQRFCAQQLQAARTADTVLAGK